MGADLGDRALFVTDGVIEEIRRGGANGMSRLRNLVERLSDVEDSVQETACLLSRALMRERGGV